MNWLRFAKLAINRQVGFNVKDYTNYIRFQEFQALEIVKEINSRNIPLNDLSVLELAAGIGGYSTILDQSCQFLVSSDIYRFPMFSKNHSLNFLQFDATKQYPFADNTFDLIFCSSLIEHVENPEYMLGEIKRVLKDNGYLYVSFPPFYSPNGGHYFAPFHLLGEKLAIKITRKTFKAMPSGVTSYSNCWAEGRGLFRRTIRSVKKMLDECDFETELIWPRFLMKFNVAKIPILNEFLCWHVCFICRNKKIN